MNRHVAVLRKRARHLAARIAMDPRDLSYDKAELAAIEWVLRRLVAMGRATDG